MKTPDPRPYLKTFSPFSWHTGRFLLLCVLVGVVAGFGAIAFYWMLEGARHFFLEILVGYAPPGPAGERPLFPEGESPFRPWMLLIVPAIGGLISGSIVYFFAPEAGGHGTDAAIESYHFRQGAVRGRVPLIKAITSAITIGSGGSGGREGPIAQIGAGFGSLVATKLGLLPDERRRLMAAGMASGIGAIFHAPLAGALFAAEVLYRDVDLEHEVIVPAFIASIVSYSIFGIAFGWSPVFLTPDFVFDEPSQLLPYTILAVVVALGAALFIKVFYFTHDRFERLKVPGYLKPAIGGLAVGIFGFVVWLLPDAYFPLIGALGTGYGVIQTALTEPHTLGLVVLIGVGLGKMLTTALSIGSGGSGGVFGPSVVIGGALGGAVGLISERLFPGMDIHPGSFVLVGMAGFFAAAAHTPISTIIMVSEMTGNYHLLVPSMLVCVLGSLLTHRVTLYHKQLRSRLDAPSKMGNMLSAVLGKITVAQALGVGPEKGVPKHLITVPEAMTLRSIIDHYHSSDQSCFPIVDAAGAVTGMIDGRDIRRALGEEELVELIVARDLARRPVKLTLSDNLLQATRLMNEGQTDEVIVVEATNGTKPLAVLNRETIARAYDHALYSGQS